MKLHKRLRAVIVAGVVSVAVGANDGLAVSRTVAQLAPNN
jgi:hypothetical protein